MKMQRSRLVHIPLALLFAGLGLALWWHLMFAGTAHVSGTVVDASGPVTGARVRIRATENMTLTNSAGGFTLAGLVEGEGVEVTAWADGYYIAGTVVTPTASDVVLTLRRYHTRDHPDYEWVSPLINSSEKACGNCHPMIISQWQDNAHGGAISNPRFYSLYNGTDLSGTLPVGPGYVNDFPAAAGNCANCHAPGAGLDGYTTTNMNSVREMLTAGIHCDYCHKVGGVYLDPASGSLYPNAPGVQSQRVLRPPEGDTIFFGPYDDIPDPDTYLPLTHQSQFCAPCHQFSFWGTPIYESYNEWLASPYAREGLTCQACHMPPTGDQYFALPEVGGLAHPPEKIPSHLQLGAANPALLRDTLEMSIETFQVGGDIVVTVVITNTGAGHHVPTDHPGRHMILTVSALDGDGIPLQQVSGGTVPAWGGNQAGKPGRAFAKVLRDVKSGQYPVVSYWSQTLIVLDNRIPARESDTSEYKFRLPDDAGAVTINAEIIFRRLFQDVMDSKGWNTPDVVMEKESKTILTEPWWRSYFPSLFHRHGIANRTAH